jgi:hypothetical protein
MPAPDAPEDQQAHDNHDSPDDPPCRPGVCALASRRLLGVVIEPLGVGAGGELVDGTGQSVPALLDLVLNLLGGCAAASFKVRLVRT